MSLVIGLVVADVVKGSVAFMSALLVCEGEGSTILKNFRNLTHSSTQHNVSEDLNLHLHITEIVS